MFKSPQNNGKYLWTSHGLEKMKFYGISESRIKRIIRFPKRVEEGIAPKTVAVMQPAETKHYQEIWVMYKLQKSNKPTNKNEELAKLLGLDKKIKIITAWRYPGKSPERDPIPQDIIQEIQTLL